MTRRRKHRPTTDSTIAVRTYPTAVVGDPQWMPKQVSGVIGYVIGAPVEIAGIQTKAQRSVKIRSTEVNAQANIETPAPSLSRKQDLARYFERQRKMTIRDSSGVIKRRGLSGAMLWQYVATKLNAHGYPEVTAEDVPGILNEIERIEMVKAELEAG